MLRRYVVEEFVELDVGGVLVTRLAVATVSFLLLPRATKRGVAGRPECMYAKSHGEMVAVVKTNRRVLTSLLLRK